MSTEKPQGPPKVPGAGPASEPAAERVVIRDKRRIDQAAARYQSSESGAGRAGTGASEPATPTPAGEAAPSARPSADADAPGVSGPAAPGPDAELDALRAELDERTRDLQRVTAEYANYRKRMDRDRGVAVEQTTAAVLGTLLPVLDDLDRAREHGDLVGPFAAVAEHLLAAVGKFGLTAFGESGDVFDPTRHEAVAHRTSSEVTEPTCVDVMRRGYLLGERLVRPAMVAVADPT